MSYLRRMAHGRKTIYIDRFRKNNPAGYTGNAAKANAKWAKLGCNGVMNKLQKETERAVWVHFAMFCLLTGYVFITTSWIGRFCMLVAAFVLWLARKVVTLETPKEAIQREKFQKQRALSIKRRTEGGEIDG